MVEKRSQRKNQRSRVGARSIITSVAVSKEFDEFMYKFNISPTDVFRKGMGVTLYEEGVDKYKTPLNKKRLEGAKKILQELKEFEDQIKLLKKVKKAIEQLDSIYTQLNTQEDKQNVRNNSG